MPNLKQNDIAANIFSSERVCADLPLFHFGRTEEQPIAAPAGNWQLSS
jgi:hypothetical protein